MIFTFFGVFLAFTSEIYEKSPRYNVALLLAVIYATGFSGFPQKSIRPYIVVFVAITISVVLDVIAMSHSDSVFRVEGKAVLCGVIVSKLWALYQFLRTGKGTEKARKFIGRRLKIFVLPTAVPKRILRDIRVRILAIEWLQGISGFSYILLFVLSITAFDFNFSEVSNATGITVSLFLLVKSS